MCHITSIEDNYVFTQLISPSQCEQYNDGLCISPLFIENTCWLGRCSWEHIMKRNLSYEENIWQVNMAVLIQQRNDSNAK